MDSKKRKHHSTAESADKSPGAPKKKKEKREKNLPQPIPSVAGQPPLQEKKARDKLGKDHSTKASKDASTKALSDAAKLLKTKPAKDKGKSRASDQPSEFRVINASLVLSVPPVFASDLQAGVEEMLDSMVMRYIPSLRGVLLAHSNLRFLSQTASIRVDCPFAVCNVCFDATVWSPCVSMKLVGKINLCSPDHVSLLVHRTFNVSIPRHHIPQDQWVFEYGPAENDPEFGEGRGWETETKSKGKADGEEDIEMQDANGDGEKKPEEVQEAESSGRWVHHLTGGKLGDPDGYLEFTVIGLTVANEMLSLQGSIQPDPFSPEHVPQTGNQHTGSRASTPASPPTTTISSARNNTSSQLPRPEEDDQTEENEDDEEEDGFKHLAKLTDEATQEAKREQEEAERLERKAKKRKRREENANADGVIETDEDGKNAKREKKKHSKRKENQGNS
ncbi:hypothetical protein HYDPIDRAFT_165588 [Hydnomerulius pinastri MD-312]|nr:hypothetical protein HYDPIDRAFT_165588 [Hydnomerulius pinastri MD-312]